MAIISKELFYETVGPKLACSEIFHSSTTSCTKALLDFILQVAIGSSKLFLLVHVIKTIKGRNKVDTEYIKTEVLAFLREMVFAVTFGINFHGSLCLMRVTWSAIFYFILCSRCFGTFYYYIVAVSGMFAGLSIFLREQEQRAVDTTICVNFAIEAMLRSLYTENVMKESVAKETLLFMSCSAVLMYLLKKSNPDNTPTYFWFYNPSRSKPSSNRTSGRSVLTYIYKGFTRYFLIGYLIQILKQLLPMPGTITSNPVMILRTILSKDMLLSGLLFGSYVGIYRMVTCFLYQHEKDEKSWHALVGGLLAGSAYMFKPTISLLAIALTTTLQLTVRQSSFASNLQSKLPAMELLFATCMGIAFHARMLLPDACPAYVKQLMNSTSNGRVQEIYKHSSNILKHLQRCAT